MRKFCFAMWVIAVLGSCGSASAHEWSNGHARDYRYAPPGYGTEYSTRGYGLDYRNDYYAQLYRNYLVFLRDCREHLRFHQELDELRAQSRSEGYRGRGEWRDENAAARFVHDQWHRNHPVAIYCPSFEGYVSQNRQPYSGNPWRHDGNDYWRR